MADELQVPKGVDPTTPNVARMYDYYLGGKDNFAADREAGDRVLAAFPDAPLSAWANRDFIRRAVRYLSGAGITQFLDIGSGLPTQGNVHEIADGGHVTYVDYDPVVVRHAEALLGGASNVSVIHADLRRPDDVLRHPDLGVDLSRPVALLLVAILHFVPDDEDPYSVVARYRDALAPGSHLVISHTTPEGVPEDLVREGCGAYSGSTASITPRSRPEIMRFLDGFELIDPGVTWIKDWRPDEPNTARSHAFAGIGRKTS